MGDRESDRHRRLRQHPGRHRDLPAGKDTVGIGATVAGNGPGQVFLTGVFPSADLRGANATAAEAQTGYTGGWTVTA
jgi:hypothetical protein